MPRSGLFAFMDYLTLLQRPFYETKYNPATKGLSTSPLDDFWYQDAKRDDDTCAPMLWQPCRLW